MIEIQKEPILRRFDDSIGGTTVGNSAAQELMSERLVLTCDGGEGRLLMLFIVVFERLILGLHVLWLEEFGFDLSSSLSTDWIGLEISSPFPASYNTMPLDMLRCNRNDNGNSLNFYSTLCFPTRFSRKTFGQGGNSALRYLTANERTSSSICSS